MAYSLIIGTTCINLWNLTAECRAGETMASVLPNPWIERGRAIDEVLDTAFCV